MTFSLDHAGCQSTVAKNEKNQEKIGQNLKILHTQELDTSAKNVYNTDSKRKSLIFLRKKNFLNIFDFFS